MGAQRERFTEATQLQHYTGIAPVTKRSGGSCYIHRRYLCPSSTSKAFTSMPGKVFCGAGGRRPTTCNSAPRVVRITPPSGPGLQMAAVIFRCWQNHTPYQEAIYEAALRKHGSPLVALFDKVDWAKVPSKTP